VDRNLPLRTHRRALTVTYRPESAPEDFTRKGANVGQDESAQFTDQFQGTVGRTRDAHYNGFGDTVTLPGVVLGEGDHEATLEYEALGNRQGRGRLLLDVEEAVGWMAMSPTLSFGVFEGLDVGLDRRGPVFPDLFDRHGSFPYSGSIRDIRIEPGMRAPRS
jgi:arylsulfatase